MENSIETTEGKLVWEADTDGITFTHKNSRKRVKWKDVTYAGIVKVYSEEKVDKVAESKALAKETGFKEQLLELIKTYRQLVFARGKSSFKAVRFQIPINDPATELLLGEIKQRLQNRWIGEVMKNDYGKAFDIRLPLWAYPVYALPIFIIGGLLILSFFLPPNYDILSLLLDLSALKKMPSLFWILIYLWLGISVRIVMFFDGK